MRAETIHAPAHTPEILITLSVFCLTEGFTSCGLASARLHGSLETVMFCFSPCYLSSAPGLWSPRGGNVLRWVACDPTVAGTSHLPE